MKNSQKGFIVPLLIAIIAVLVIGGGIYIYNNKKAEAPVLPIDINTDIQTTNQTQQQTNTQNPPANNKSSITVLSPNGGEVFKVGSTQTISWKTTGLSKNSKVTIILSSVGTGGSREGDAYQLISTTDNIGKYTWVVTSPMSLSPNNTYNISIYDYTNSQIIDINDTPFSITSSVSTSGWKTYSENNVSIQIPQNLKFVSGVPVVLGGCAKGFTISNSTAGTVVLTLYKYNNKVCFDEDHTNFTSQYSDWRLINSNYSFNGEVGEYYSRSTGGYTTFAIILPTKFIEISVEDTNYSKVSASDLIKILASVQF